MPLILCAGGGTLGPVTPLLAVVRVIKKQRPDIHFAWAGTPNGPEREIVEAEGIPFYPIHVAKLPRYPSLQWVTWPLDYLKARKQAQECLDKTRPALVCSMGGFTSVPVIRQAAKRGIPCAIHQLDVLPGLSNKQLARECASITTSFTYDRPPFQGVSSIQIATPCRFAGISLASRDGAARTFGLDPQRSIIFMTGGGTGAATFNEMIKEQLDEFLSFTQLIHLTGKEKKGILTSKKGYYVAEFFDEQQMLQAYSAADLVISRAGLGALSELASLSKPSVLVPIPHSHQEYNASLPLIPVVQQGPDFFLQLIKKAKQLLSDKEQSSKIGKKLHEILPTDDGSALAEKWLKLL